MHTDQASEVIQCLSPLHNNLNLLSMYSTNRSNSGLILSLFIYLFIYLEGNWGVYCSPLSLEKKKKANFLNLSPVLKLEPL